MEDQNQFSPQTTPQPGQSPMPNQPQAGGFNSVPAPTAIPAQPSPQSMPPQQPIAQSPQSQQPVQLPGVHTFQNSQPQIPTSFEVQPTPAAASPFQSKPAKKRGKLKFAVVGLLALAVLGGGSAAAYYGMVVPNQPHNVLKTAMRNSLTQPYVTASGEIEGKDKESPAYKANMTIKSDLAKKASSAELKLTIAGVVIPVESRLIDSSIYLRVGDVSTLKAVFPEYGSIVEVVNNTLKEQWIEIDSTLVSEAGARCVLDTELRMTDEDFAVLEQAYAKSPFANIANTAEETVNGKSVIKYEINLDDTKGEAFAKELSNLPLVKKLNDCNQQQQSRSEGLDQEKPLTTELPVQDTGISSMTLWVDKETKLITQMQTEASEKERKDAISVKATIALDYEPVSIEKPEGSKPVTSFLAELSQIFEQQQTPVLGWQFERFLSPDANTLDQ